ncbi:DUF4320 family protein [Clostridioides difficile]|nr:DUF4320 family protein [Clostridioides difficile]MCL6901976.1 DUF4320 family protein [Clostridioides difficile]MCP3377844.1 DUF4320 family protein [Clostridioides difficile]MDE3493474.1 DUF4320 family protein [Clostridioides difficile]MDE3707875.1 DUF4320 family protein [Clostridioides difficile]
MKKLLKDTRGEFFIEAPIIIFVLLIFVGFAISIYPAFITWNNLDSFAKEVIREAEISGEIGEDVNKKIEKLKETNIKPDSIEWDTIYINGSKKVQLNDEINIVVKKTVDIGFFEFGSFPIPLEGKSTGRSEVYWK